MRRFFAGLLAFQFWVLWNGARAWDAAVPPAPSGVEHVVIVSVDGGSPAVMQQTPMPVLERLVRQGAHTWSAQTILPPVTLPSHTSMLTGVVPEKHGITWNGWSPDKGLVRVPTVFSVAKSAGRSTAMFVGKEKFRHLLLPGTVDEFCYNRALSQLVTKSESGGGDMDEEPNTFARSVAAQAAEYIVRHKPNLCFIHLTDPDALGHKFGWGSPEQKRALEAVDAALGRVMEALGKARMSRRTVLILSADHGGRERSHGSPIPENMTIPWVVWGRGVRKNFTITAPVNTCDTAATALWLLGLEPSGLLDGKPVTSAFVTPRGRK
jgi:predicted AlkP superfamily pyrophosphatase or phosphodiesterase